MSAVVLPGRRKIEQLCGRCGITPTMLRRYLHGDRKPAPWVADEIARTLGRDVADLFPTIEQPTQQPTDVHCRAEL